MSDRIKAHDVTTFVFEIENENKSLQSRVKYLEEHGVISDRFYAVPLTTAEVAKLHGVHPKLVRRYIDLGLIDKHPLSTDAKLLVRASDALLIDFKDLKKTVFLKKSTL